MVYRRSASIAVLFVCLGLSHAAAAPPEPLGSGPYASGDVIQAIGESGTIASRVLKQASLTAMQDQIRFDIKMIRVDSETRDKIYRHLGTQSIQTEITAVESESAGSNNESIQPSLASRHRTLTGSIVSTAVVDQEQLKQILRFVKQGAGCEIAARPTIIAADGQVAAIQQKVQRPFLSKLEKVDTGEESAVRSDIQVLDEGLDFVVQADVDGEALNVMTKIQQSRVVDVKQHNVYGIGEGEKVIQVPSHEVRLATASQRLLPQQTLLLDPYFQTVQRTAVASGVPVFNKVPYVNRVFKNEGAQVHKSNLLVLLTARKLAPKMPPKETAASETQQ